MMNEKQFIESQKECAAMLGMSLSEYQKFCANVKVPTEREKKENDDKNQDLMSYFGISKSMLKTRKDAK